MFETLNFTFHYNDYNYTFKCVCTCTQSNYLGYDKLHVQYSPPYVSIEVTHYIHTKILMLIITTHIHTAIETVIIANEVEVHVRQHKSFW